MTGRITGKKIYWQKDLTTKKLGMVGSAVRVRGLAVASGLLLLFFLIGFVNQSVERCEIGGVDVA